MLQFKVDVVVYLLVTVIDATCALAQPLDELEILVIHGTLDMQQTHTVSHLLGHLFLKGSRIAQAHFHHVTIGAGAAVAISHGTAAAALSLEGYNGYHHEQQNCCHPEEMSVCHLFHCFLGYFSAKLGNLLDDYNISSVFPIKDNPRCCSCNGDCCG